MINLEKHLSINPYSLDIESKNKFFSKQMAKLIRYHFKKCKEYKNILTNINYDLDNCLTSKMPYIPVTLFKELELLSVPKKKIIKTLVSSGTTGNRKSIIHLDNNNSKNQIKILSKLFSQIIGKNRLPMLIIDSKSIFKDRNLFSARVAAINGFSFNAKDITYALDDSLNIKINELEKFFINNKNKKIIIFGFTYLLWNYFYKALINKNKEYDLSNCIIIHGGGWKKLQNESVNNSFLKSSFNKNFKISNIYNYYGMVEQSGSIFFECKEGYYHTSIFSDILIRNNNLNLCKLDEEGIIELFSLLPSSYPGHIILTQDKGTIVGIDNCKCGKLGKYFEVNGRLLDSETRGCSDTIT